ncbi:hypothetical protein EJ110_NYTH21294 [Nymphaea thermarum]|nr:hypothetical protein EJ110_NYTH21294 [Nymphaea thermarum]
MSRNFLILQVLLRLLAGAAALVAAITMAVNKTTLSTLACPSRPNSTTLGHMSMDSPTFITSLFSSLILCKHTALNPNRSLILVLPLPELVGYSTMRIETAAVFVVTAPDFRSDALRKWELQISTDTVDVVLPEVAIEEELS